MNQQLQVRFSAAHATYDRVAYVQKRSAQLLADRLHSFAPNFFPNTILDLGAGTGYVTEILLPRWPMARFTLNDIAPGMLLRSQDKFAAYHNISYCLADFEQHAFVSYDLVISNFALQWARDLLTTLSDFNEKAQIFAFSCLLNGTFTEWAQLLAAHGLTSPVAVYPTEQQLIAWVTGQFRRRYDFFVDEMILTFANARAFVTYLKQLGATSSQVVLPTAQLYQLLQQHRQPLVITYRVFFGLLADY